MATKRVSVSGLPHLTNTDLKNNPSDSTRTSFFVSSRRQVGGINTSYQLDYAQLYTAISSQIADQFNIKPTVGANNKPIYLTDQKFTASTQNIGTDGQFPITLRGGEFKTLPGIGTDIQPIYVNINGRLTSSAGNVGSSSNPIYMSAGKLQASSSNIGSNYGGAWQYLNNDYQSGWRAGTFKPIYMAAGSLAESNATIGGQRYSNAWGCWCSRPIYMEAGTLKEFTTTIGGDTRPTYMYNGEIVPCGGYVGNSGTPIYMAGGQFYACNMATPSIGFSSFTPYATVVFTTNGNGDSADQVDNTDLIRVVDLSVYNGTKAGVEGVVDFYIDTAGWYLIYSETSNTGKNAVLVSDSPTSWTFWHPHIRQNLPKTAFYNKSIQGCMCALINVKAGAYIGVHPNLGSNDGAAFSIYSSSATTDAPATDNADVAELKCGPTMSDKATYYCVGTTGTGSAGSPFDSKTAWKNWWKTLDFDSQKWYFDNKKYFYYWGNSTHTTKKIIWPKAVSQKLRTYYLNNTSLWSNKDTIYVMRCI